jgi:DNA-dependent RNA polymerase auxiliary subunit epsilon
MTRRNISHTHTALENRAETEQVYIDGDSTEAIFRALINGQNEDEFTEWVEDELDVAVQKTKWVGIGLEVTVK